MKEKIKNFAVNNWDGIATLGIIAIAEAYICKIFKDWVNKN